MKRLFSLAALIAALPSFGQEVTVRKAASDLNPPLYIADVKAPGPIQTQLRSTLRRSNWFKIVKTPSKARYVLRASYARTTAAVVKMRLSAGDGQVLSFKEIGRGADADRVVYAAVDTLIEKLFDNPGPCNSRIAFVLGQKGRKEIFTCNFDGTAPRQLTRNGTISTEPAWGPHGEQLVYTLYNRNRTAIILVDTKRRRQRHIAGFRGLNSGASIAPGGGRIALCLSLNDQVDLYSVSMTGEPEKRLTNGPAVESSACWNPNGRRLCYVSDRAGRPHLYLRALGGGRSTRLVTDNAEQVSPDWSSISGKICFSTRKGGRYVIAVTDPGAPGDKAKVVTSGQGDWESPSWAPDGRHVVCIHTYAGRRRLVMVDTLSGRVIPILQKQNISLPSWGPSAN